jgi:hypothetical protein
LLATTFLAEAVRPLTVGLLAGVALTGVALFLDDGVCEILFLKSEAASFSLSLSSESESELLPEVEEPESSPTNSLFFHLGATGLKELRALLERAFSAVLAWARKLPEGALDPAIVLVG